MPSTDTKLESKEVQALYDAGAHFGYGRRRRHPSVEPYLFGSKNKSDIIDLEATATALERAAAYVASLAASGKQIWFVGGKQEVVAAVKAGAQKAGVPFVAGRWIGGTLTNAKQIRSRIDRLMHLRSERDMGLRDKYTKKERLLMDRDIENLEFRFGGLETMESAPAALFVVDTRHEKIAVAEANQMGIPVIGLANTDCDFGMIQYPIPANDSVSKSVTYVVQAIASAYRDQYRAPVKPKTPLEEEAK